jgi:hypothetical protein
MMLSPLGKNRCDADPGVDSEALVLRALRRFLVGQVGNLRPIGNRPAANSSQRSQAGVLVCACRMWGNWTRPFAKCSACSRHGRPRLLGLRKRTGDQIAAARSPVGQPILAAAAFQAAFSPCEALVLATSDTFRLAIPRLNREAPKRLTSAKTLYNTQQLLYNLQREKRRTNFLNHFSQPPAQ